MLKWHNSTDVLTEQNEGEQMKSCFLFGHADTPDSIMSKLDEAIESLNDAIEESDEDGN